MSSDDPSAGAEVFPSLIHPPPGREYGNGNIVLDALPLVLSGVGLFISIALSLTETSGKIVPCGGSSGCAVVAGSPYSHFLGIPVATIGIAGYGAILLLAVLSSRLRLALRLSVAATLFGTAASLVLIALSATSIHATCLWCMASAGTMTLLFGVSLARLRVGVAASVWLQAGIAVCAASAAWFGASRIAANAERLILNQSVLSGLSDQDLAPERSPSRGDAKSPVTVIEFADFACPACRDIEPRLTKFLSHTTGMRLVFRNLPQPFFSGHEASGYGAVCGEIAREKGLFWQFAAKAFSTPDPAKADYDRILNQIGVNEDAAKRIADKNDPAVRNVDEDLKLAHRLELSLTPCFIVISPDLPRQIGTNLNLVNLLNKPQILRYLKQTHR